MNERLATLEEKYKLRDYFFGFMTERRAALFEQVLQNRTRYLTIVLEDIYQSHNTSAVLRSCDCFGVQDVHIIENSNPYEVNPDIALGSSQWLSLKHYNQGENNTRLCLQELRQKGYRIVATTPRMEAPTLDEFDIASGKIALVFGTEKDGLTGEAVSMADQLVRIPMVGFTESFNISVSAALCLYHFTTAIRKSEASWQLSEDERLDVLLDWCRVSIRKSHELEKLYLKNI